MIYILLIITGIIVIPVILQLIKDMVAAAKDAVEYLINRK